MVNERRVKIKRNKKGIVELAGCAALILGFIGASATHYYVKTGKNIFKAKPKTVDTIENPAKPEVPYNVSNFK